MKGSEEGLLKYYRYYLRVERKMSPNTVASYCSDVAAFVAVLEEESSSKAVDFRKVDSAAVVSYLSGRAGKVSKRSQARQLSALRSFFDWLILEGERSDNPCDMVDSPKLGRYLPEVLSVEEVTKIIEGVDTRSWQGVRDRAILEILYGCGLRVSEVCDLKISNVYWMPSKNGFPRGPRRRLRHTTTLLSSTASASRSAGCRCSIW